MTANSVICTPIIDLGSFLGNRLLVKRDDLLPFSFGGNKARKAALYFKEVVAGGYNHVVTYGSGSSNHSRVISNLCSSLGIGCTIVCPQEASKSTSNSRMAELFGAEFVTVPVSQVHDTIEGVLECLCAAGREPYFIAGGGHGVLGTRAYVQCFNEIMDWSQENEAHIDRIFLASGTGTTQAGLVCGKVESRSDCQIVGISVARKNPYGRNVVVESVSEFLGAEADMDEVERATIFLDDYVAGGYAEHGPSIMRVIEYALSQYGIPLDPTYTGKAFWGMSEELKKADISGETVMFLHTGGTPLFFDDFGNRYCGD